MLPGPVLLPPRPAHHRCQAEPPPGATCPSQRCHTWPGRVHTPQFIRGFLPQSSLALGVGRASAVVGGRPGFREGKGPVQGCRDLGHWGLKRSQTCEDPVPSTAQGLDPWSAGGVTLAIQASTFASAPHSATPTHSGVPTPILSCWLRRLQDITHAIPAPKEPHWQWGVAQTRKEIPLHQAGSGNARAEIPIQRSGF